MPLPNDFRHDDGGDGLNWASHRWKYVSKGIDNIYGVGENNARKNLTLRLDHNFNDRHRVSGNYTHEWSGGQEGTFWPDSWGGTTTRRPQRFSVSYTASIKPTLLNEARFGLNRNKSHSENAVDSPDNVDEIRPFMQSLVPTDDFVNFPAGEPFVVMPYRFQTNAPYNSHFIGGRAGSVWVHSFLPTWGGYDHRWSMADTLTWMKGRHSFKFGAEIRLTRSHQDADGLIGFTSAFSMPTAFGGSARYNSPQDLYQSVDGVATYPEGLEGLVGTTSYFDYGTVKIPSHTGTVGGMNDLRDYMAGSLSHIWQWFFINDPFDKTWNDINAGEITRVLDIRQKEMAFFAKDDWKVNNSLTLNLGLRYEYFGVPWLDRGMTLGLAGGANALFGVSGRDFTTWMAEKPINLEETRTPEQIEEGFSWLTQQEFIGPGSPQEDVSVFEKDYNNFGPAVGFAWQLPWFGKGKTTLRGGYQMTFSQVSTANIQSGGFSEVLAGSTGTNFDYYYSGDVDTPYLRIADLDDYLPTKKHIEADDDPIVPLETLKIENRSSTLTVYDPDMRTPYQQSLNLSLTRNIGSYMSLDLRYVGTLARKQVASLNLNSKNWIKNGLKDALDEARAGGDPEIFQKLYEGVSFDNANLLLPNSTSRNQNPVGSPLGPTGGDVVRALYAANLANGDYNSIAGSLNTENYTWREGGYPYWFWPWYYVAGLNEGLPEPGISEVGTMLRHANSLYPGEFPENFIVANPQLGTANWYTNLNHNNYHSMQAVFTVRPTHGFNMTATYTFAKNLGNNSYTNPNDRTNPFDYTWTGNNSQHQLNTYGQITLPFGANGFFFRDVSNPVVRRIIEGWQMSWIMSMRSGGWTNISVSPNHLYGNSVPSIVRPDLFDPTDTAVEWAPGALNGYYFGAPDEYMMGPDLQCLDNNLVDPSIQESCTLGALYIPLYQDVEVEDPDTGEITIEQEPVYSPENVIMQHPLPGEYGNFGRNKVMGIGSFSLDMALSKNFQITEGKSFGLRVDAGNILNHPSPSGPTFSIARSGNPLGYISSKNGNRTFQAKFTLRF